MSRELSVCSYEKVCEQAYQNIIDKDFGFRFREIIKITYFRDFKSHQQCLVKFSMEFINDIYVMLA